MQDGGVQIIDMHLVLYCCEPGLIRHAVNMASLDAAVGEPDRQAVTIMVASGRGHQVRQLRRGHAAKLAAREDERVIEHAALLGVAQESGDGRSTSAQAAGRRWVISP